MATITSTGYGSGLAISDIVSQLVEAEGSPAQTRLDSKESKLQTELSAIGLLKSYLSDLQSSVEDLTDAASFTSRSARSSDSSVASFSVEESASLGSYSLQVDNLATAHKLVGQSGYTAGDTGSLTFSNASGDTFSVDIGSGDATLQGIRDAINNASDNFGMTATILNLPTGSRLVLTSDETGADGRITSISSTSSSGDLSIFDYTYTGNADSALDGDDTNYDQVTAAADASYTLEGQALTSASNTIAGVIPGATITLNAVSEANSPVTLTVSTNTSDVKSTIESFVDSYNALQSLIAQQTSYDADTGTAGTLLGDAMTRTIQNQLRSALSSISGDGGISSLTQLGITTQRDGQLAIDSSKLSDALNNNFEQVTGFFSDKDTGLATRLDSFLQTYLKSGGTFASRTDSINSQIDDITDQREALSLRLDKLEARLLAQYNAMDAMIAQLNSTGDYLTQQLASIANIGNSNND